jgi:hypothetical protein
MQCKVGSTPRGSLDDAASIIALHHCKSNLTATDRQTDRQRCMPCTFQYYYFPLHCIPCISSAEGTSLQWAYIPYSVVVS